MSSHSSNDPWANVEAAYPQNAAEQVAPSNLSALAEQPVPVDATESSAYPEPVATEPVELGHLESALKALDPDCQEKTWANHRVAPLANAARDNPDLADTLFDLAVRWSSGKLRGQPAKTWAKSGTHGAARRTRLHFVWERFRYSPYEGKRVTIRTIFFHARAAGWTEPEVPEDEGGTRHEGA